MVRHVSDPPRLFRGALAQTRRRKRATNVSIDEELLAEARKLNLSETLEDALRAALREERIREFQEQNREAFDSYNRFIEKHGLWGQEYRK